jgi:PIN domain nuclease of toxin-antitoxin system
MLLLDTCALLWLSSDQSRLSVHAREMLVTHAGEVFVSSISAFEVALKAQAGKIELGLAADDWFAGVLVGHGVGEVEVDGLIAARSAMLPAIHKDPCDRIIIATALAEGFQIVSPDAVMAAYPGVVVCW